MKKLSEASDIDERKFLGEVDCLMKAKHKNIVQFLGYCSDTQGQYMEHNGTSVMVEVRHRLLCFEYLPNGSLDKYIKGMIVLPEFWFGLRLFASSILMHLKIEGR